MNIEHRMAIATLPGAPVARPAYDHRRHIAKQVLPEKCKIL
ncbi:MAG: hypothetical protein WCS27_13130 [Victivallaceae bacterium]